MSEFIPVRNHLVIGLGGTGGRIIRELRKLAAQGDAGSSGVHFEYLYVDSSPELMHPEDPTWRVPGKSVQLGAAQQLLIEGQGLSQLLDNIDAYPNIKPWIGPLNVIQEIARGTVGAALGGQRRKFGRFLFACNARTFVQRLQDRVREVKGHNGDAALTFHVFAGLAGGTGSGSIVDVVAQLRRQFPNPGTHRIQLYAYLPETHPKAGHDTGNYHANGYAALAELNALAIGAYRPHDLAGNGERLQLDTPFHGCYVFSSENEKGTFVDVEHALPRIVAEFMYQKTRGVNWRELASAEKAENGNFYDEMAVDGSRAERSKRFLAFGIHRMEVPNQEIQEYLTYQFAQQAARQVMFNHWLDGMGYAAEPAPKPLAEEVARPETHERWCLSDDHLTLSRGVLPADASNAKWKPVAEFWSGLVRNQHQDVKHSKPKQQWLAELGKRCDQVYDEGYRGLGGVRKFYEIKLKDRAVIARHIRNTIERELLGDWRNGQRSLAEVQELLKAVRRLLEEKLAGADERVTRLQAQEKEAADSVSARVREWAGVNWLSDLLGKGEKLFNAAAEDLTRLFICRTQAAGWIFGKKLLEELMQQLDELAGEVQRLFARMSVATKAFEQEIASRLKDEGGKEDGRWQRIYDRELVESTARRLTMDEELQRQQAQQLRERLIGRAGDKDNCSFAKLAEALDESRIRTEIESSCLEATARAHDALPSGQRKVLDVNIVDRLAEQFGHDEAQLKRFVRECWRRAGVYMTFDAQEVAKQGPGTTEGGSPRESIFISSAGLFLPASKANPEFRARLEAAFKDDKTTVKFDTLSEGTRANEVTLIRVDNLFPQRFAAPLRMLKERYDSRCAASLQARVLLHGEGTGEQLLPLFIPSTRELQAPGERRAMLLVAHALKIVGERRHPGTGRTQAVLRYTDEDGLEQEEWLGHPMLSAAEELEAKRHEQIAKLVRERLRASEFTGSRDRRDGLRLEVVAFINQVKELCDGDLQHETYRMFAATIKPVRELLQLDSN